MKQVIRMCISCRKRAPKQELIRIVKLRDGVVDIDESQKAQTRGVYVCRDRECVGKLRKSHRLRQLFELMDDSEIIEKTENFLENDI